MLKQVKVPHPYYFREMLIPQVISGPSAAAAAVERHGEWNGEAERRDALSMLARARAEFARRAGE